MGYKRNQRNVKISEFIYSIYENAILRKLLWLISIWSQIVSLNTYIYTNDKIDTLMISETKLDDTFLLALYLLEGFSNPYRLIGEILVYVNNIPSNLIKLDQKFENFEGFFIELELSKKN